MKLEDYVQIFRIIVKFSINLSKQKTVEIVQNRRKALKAGNEKEFEKYCFDFINADQTVTQEISSKMLKITNISQQTDEKSKMAYEQTEAIQNVIFELKFSQNPKDYKPKLTIEQTIEVYKKSEKLRLDLMQKIFSVPPTN